jgi:hypothetical protein
MVGARGTKAPSNAKIMEVTDPFGNRLTFNQPLAR